MLASSKDCNLAQKAYRGGLTFATQPDGEKQQEGVPFGCSLFTDKGGNALDAFYQEMPQQASEAQLAATVGCSSINVCLCKCKPGTFNARDTRPYGMCATCCNEG